MTMETFQRSALVGLIFFAFVNLGHCQSPSSVQFVFGDSLVDQGNNNYLSSIAKANFKPNGLDLKLSNGQPTGRFSNGRIVSDFISEHMGMEPILAYLDPAATGNNLLRGASFASAGSGILDDTGAIFIQHLTIPQQIAAYQKVQVQITSLVGATAANEIFAKAVHSFTIGGNDFINNYLLPGSARASQYSVGDYTVLMVNTFREQIKDLYKLGARKISISNIGPIGCIPSQLIKSSQNGECVDSLNQLAIGFNSLLQPMTESLNQELPGVKIVVANSFAIVSDLIANKANYGFTTSNTACCGVGRFNGLLPCSQLVQVCSNRDEYLFWDAFHPTDKANSIVTNRILFGPTSDISPINVSQLMAL